MGITIQEMRKMNWTRPKRKRHSLVDWMMMTDKQVMSEFANLPNAKIYGEGMSSFVYIPGTRKDRVLLVAHADTVHNKSDGTPKELDIAVFGGNMFSLKQDAGIGADDRAGCAMLWRLKDMGHSLLIPNGEEKGCVGSRYLKDDHKDLFKQINEEHQFAIEMDRQDDNDMAFYEIGTNKFKDWCEKEFVGYKRVRGMWTDVCILCDTMCGMNISVGYRNQHRPEEFLFLPDWKKTLNAMTKVMSLSEIPKFQQDEPRYIYNRNGEDDWPDWPTTNVRNRRTNHTYHKPLTNDSWKSSQSSCDIGSNNLGLIESLLMCPECLALMDESEYKDNHKKCIYCNKG